MKKLGIVLMLLVTIVLVGCKDDNSENINEKDNEAVTKELWDTIVDIEFSATNIMGESVYFYEKDATLYCDFWLSGSGVPAIFFHTSEVEIDEDGNIIVDVPVVMMGGFTNPIDKSVEKVTIEYVDGVIFLKETSYGVSELNSREQVLEWVAIEN